MKAKEIKYFLQIFDVWNNGAGEKMRDEVHILVNCPDTFLKEKQHSALEVNSDQSKAGLDD